MIITNSIHSRHIHIPKPCAFVGNECEILSDSMQLNDWGKLYTWKFEIIEASKKGESYIAKVKSWSTEFYDMYGGSSIGHKVEGGDLCKFALKININNCTWKKNFHLECNILQAPLKASEFHI